MLIVSVNRDAIVEGRDNPIEVRQSRDGGVHLFRGVKVFSPSVVRVVYDPDNPLPDGTRVWVEIEEEVDVLEEAA